jgi:hypothetical protein
MKGRKEEINENEFIDGNAKLTMCAFALFANDE